MDIINLPFEEPLTLTVNGVAIKLVTFRTLEHGNIKFGIDAPRSLKVNREEVYLALNAEENNSQD
ncbi:MAG: carbon storage regulator [Legionellales bacterium RIFCSPHIGHO2_12_FULL_37_14]|nr:MAG: carbon storage regulator [Legionellales bacterium RIFCSPHIGHO2_12_FULL_37_14]